MSAVAVKISTKLAISTSSRLTASEVLKAGAPKSVLAIPYAGQQESLSLNNHGGSGSKDPVRSPGAVIAQVGATRRISILDPHLTCEEIDGLAYRIKILGRNESLNSILLANNVERASADMGLPVSALEFEKENLSILEDITSPGYDKVWYASGGYDARALHDASSQEKLATLEAVTKLAVCVMGSAPSNDPKSEEDDTYDSKIPFISIPHGLITDGGYALAMGSYVLATSDSRFRIENPLRGLALDPIGLSYFLPRLGWEFDQPSVDYPVGSILALTGYEADASDMIETGLATHFIDSFGKLASLERALAQLDPYGQQRIQQENLTRYGANSRSHVKKIDVNKRYRNVAVASLLESFSTYNAVGQVVGDLNYLSRVQMNEDPSLVLDSDKTQMTRDRESMLVNIAATFQDIFEGESSMEGILECMKEFASNEASDEEELEFVETAKDIVNRIEAQSPLAVQTVHRLMEMGKKKSATLEKCMEREKKVQLRLMGEEDFMNWAKSGVNAGNFLGWKHKSVADVSSDEVDELLAEE